MNIAFACVIFAALMPLMLAIAAKVGGISTGWRYSNATPRDSLTSLSGWPQRANWAQQNSWESFPIFASAVLMASYAQVSAELMTFWALIFVAARIAYALLYIFNLASLRSLVWSVGLLACLRLMFAAV